MMFFYFNVLFGFTFSILNFSSTIALHYTKWHVAVGVLCFVSVNVLSQELVYIFCFESCQMAETVAFHNYLHEVSCQPHLCLVLFDIISSSATHKHWDT